MHVLVCFSLVLDNIISDKPEILDGIIAVLIYMTALYIMHNVTVKRPGNEASEHLHLVRIFIRVGYRIFLRIASMSPRNAS